MKRYSSLSIKVPPHTKVNGFTYNVTLLLELRVPRTVPEEVSKFRSREFEKENDMFVTSKFEVESNVEFVKYEIFSKGKLIRELILRPKQFPHSHFIYEIKTTHAVSELDKKATKKIKLNKPKIIAVFYHGGPFGSGQIKAKSNDDTGDTGKIYDSLIKLSEMAKREFIGCIIAPAFIQNFGVSRGEKFIKKNYKKGDQIIIYGYSYGGDNAVNLCESINLTVDTLIIVDSSDGIFRGTTVDTSVPNNVDMTINMYQRRASGGFSRSKDSDSDNPNYSEKSSSDGSSNTMGSRGFPHSAEDKNYVMNVDLTDLNVKVTHGTIQRYAKNIIEHLLKRRINNYESRKVH